MKPLSLTTHRVGLVGVIALVVLTVSGCAHPTTSLTLGSGSDERAQELVAQERVAELARDIGAERPDDMDGWARAAVAGATGGSGGESADIELIGIRTQQSVDPSEPFGSLDFRVPVPEQENASTGAPGAYCFRVEFDYYGKVGTWESSDGVDPIDCPPDAAIVAPPVDDSAVAVVSGNAREVTTAVLLERGQTGAPSTVDAIVAAISAQLESPAGEFEVAAPPRVIVVAGNDGDRVGVAFGSADDCVLVKSENGAVEDVYPAPISLQPGELGCTPETALADPDQLRSPH
jgi:hypothetical protein